MKKFSFALLSVVLIYFFVGCTGDNQSGQEIPEGAVVAEKVTVSDIQANEIPQLFAAGKIEYHPVSVLNWPEQYPYLPKVDFAIAHNGDHLLVHYRVTEKRSIGTMENDLDDVYKESCCELFFMKEGDSLYYNIESNCIGSILMQCGTGRYDRDLSTAGNLKKIDRWASLGRNAIGKVNEETHWELALAIPLSALWRHSFSCLDGMTLRANVYNCVGSGDDRQYVTWRPIETDAPDFHRPEFFSRIYLKK